MSEMRGLQTIMANNGTLHGITEPPSPEHYQTYESYERAYQVWYDTTFYWSAKKS